MTRRLDISLIALGAVGLAGGAAAQTVSPAAQQLSFTGDAPPGCLMQTPSSPTSDNASVTAASPGSADIVIGQLVGEDAVPVGATVILSLPAACNQAHTLSLASLNGGLANEDGAPGAGGFRSLVPYSVALNWGGAGQTYESGDPALEVPLGDAASGAVTVTIQIPAGGQPLTAGTYSDQLVLELAAAG